jgi:hypothetical protein
MTISVREHLRLSVIEIKRIVWRKQFLLPTAVILWMTYDELKSSTYTTVVGLFGVVAAVSRDSVLNCFVAATAGAASLAADTEAGFLGLTLSRNVRRWHHILHKVAAIVAVITALTLLRYVLVYIGTAVLHPWDVSYLGPCVKYYTSPTGAMRCIQAEPTSLKEAHGPFPALFLTHPVLNDFIGALMVSVGTFVMALCGLLASTCGANVFVTMSVPVVLAFGIRLAVGDLIPGWADPTGLVYVHGNVHGLEYAGIPWFWTWLISLFAWTIGLTLLSMYIAEKRELGAKESTS